MEKVKKNTGDYTLEEYDQVKRIIDIYKQLSGKEKELLVIYGQGMVVASRG